MPGNNNNGNSASGLAQGNGNGNAGNQNQQQQTQVVATCSAKTDATALLTAFQTRPIATTSGLALVAVWLAAVGSDEGSTVDVATTTTDAVEAEAAAFDEADALELELASDAALAGLDFADCE
eukprot:tig00020830_g14490.t1